MKTVSQVPKSTKKRGRNVENWGGGGRRAEIEECVVKIIRVTLWAYWAPFVKEERGRQLIQANGLTREPIDT